MIEQGLQAGETVVIDGQLRLVPGARVDIKNNLSELATVPVSNVGDRSSVLGQPARGQTPQETQR